MFHTWISRQWLRNLFRKFCKQHIDSNPVSSLNRTSLKKSQCFQTNLSKTVFIQIWLNLSSNLAAGLKYFRLQYFTNWLCGRYLPACDLDLSQVVEKKTAKKIKHQNEISYFIWNNILIFVIKDTSFIKRTNLVILFIQRGANSLNLGGYCIF